MKIFFAIVFGAAALAACQPVPMEPDEGGGMPAAGGTMAAPAPSSSPTRTGPYVATAPLPPRTTSSPVTSAMQSDLVGEYRVAGVDGNEVDLGHAITLSITPTTVEFVSLCVRGVWRYERDQERFVTQGMPVAMCRRALFPEEQALQAVFAAGPTYVRTAGGGLRFAGGGHTVTVFSQ